MILKKVVPFILEFNNIAIITDKDIMAGTSMNIDNKKSCAAKTKSMSSNNIL